MSNYRFTKSFIRKLDDSSKVLCKLEYNIMPDGDSPEWRVIEFPKVDYIYSGGITIKDSEFIDSDRIEFDSEYDADLFYKRFKEWKGGKYGNVINPYLVKCPDYSVLYWVINTGITSLPANGYGTLFGIEFDRIYQFWKENKESFADAKREKGEEIINVVVVED